MHVMIICKFEEDQIKITKLLIGKHFFSSHGQVTLKRIIRAGPNSNSCEILCMCCLSASLMKVI